MSHVKVGRVLQAQGDLTGALELFYKGLEIAKGLARADPSNAHWQRDVSMSHEKVGGVLQA